MSHCVFLPGTMNDQRLWALLWPLLPGDFDCVHVPLEQARTRQEMQALIAAVSRPDSHLIGFSMGGYLALEFAANFPAQWQSLCLLATNSQGLASEERNLRQRMLSWLNLHRYTGMARQRLLQLLHPQNQQNSELLELIRSMDQDLGHEVLQVQLSQTKDRPDLSPVLTRFSQRLLIVHGAADALIPETDLQTMRSAAPTATWHTLNQAGHVLPLEQPAALAQVLSQFIRQQS